MYRNVIPVLAVGAIVLGLPGTAAAAVAPGGFVRTTVACPAGKVAVAGGAAVVGEGTRDFRTVMQETAPSGQLWMVAIRNNDIAAHTIGVFAVCANPPAGYERVRRDVAVGAGGFLRSTVSCPAGKVVVGGGSVALGANGSQQTVTQESNPGSIGVGTWLWLTALRNGPAAQNIALLGNCAAAPAGYQVVLRSL